MAIPTSAPRPSHSSIVAWSSSGWGTGQIQRSTIEHQQELLVVKVVANLDLPGALSITDAPRGPRQPVTSKTKMESAQCRAPVAKVRCTATWHRSTPPTEPEYWRAGATASVENFASPVVRDQDSVVVEPVGSPGRRPFQHRFFVPHRTGRQMVRAALTDRLGQAPAVDVLELHQHAPGHPRERFPGLGGQQAPERPAVTCVVYRWAERPSRSDVALHHITIETAVLTTTPPSSS
jgi:hypothetical protein